MLFQGEAMNEKLHFATRRSGDLLKLCACALICGNKFLLFFRKGTLIFFGFLCICLRVDQIRVLKWEPPEHLHACVSGLERRSWYPERQDPRTGNAEQGADVDAAAPAPRGRQRRPHFPVATPRAGRFRQVGREHLGGRVAHDVDENEPNLQALQLVQLGDVRWQPGKQPERSDRGEGGLHDRETSVCRFGGFR